jgi:hypothetical protein
LSERAVAAAARSAAREGNSRRAERAKSVALAAHALQDEGTVELGINQRDSILYF